MLTDSTALHAVILSEALGSTANSGKHANVCVGLCLIPLLLVVPLARHFYPPLTRAPSPRGYGLRLVQHELFYLLVFKILGLMTLPWRERRAEQNCKP